jgi:shikimate kinase
MRVGKAIAYGAITIVNAIATGHGAALGIDMWTRAEVRLTHSPGKIVGKVLSDPTESPTLIRSVIHRVLTEYGLQHTYGARVETDSNIPIGVGLKSSSVAANALTLATLAALGKEFDDLSVINMGVDGALAAGVTITGAFDDACASYYGGVVITDNLHRKIIKMPRINDSYVVLIHIPSKKVYTRDVDVERIKLFRPWVEVVYQKALGGDIWTAMTLNGLIYSVALGYDQTIAREALNSGAVAVGLSGTGPATAAVVPPAKADQVGKVWQAFEGRVLRTKINRLKAHILQRG